MTSLQDKPNKTDMNDTLSFRSSCTPIHLLSQHITGNISIMHNSTYEACSQ
jgi:hypothetical protein